MLMLPQIDVMIAWFTPQLVRDGWGTVKFAD
jgi:hypothetical protein